MNHSAEIPPGRPLICYSHKTPASHFHSTVRMSVCQCGGDVAHRVVWGLGRQVYGFQIWRFDVVDEAKVERPPNLKNVSLTPRSDKLELLAKAG